MSFQPDTFSGANASGWVKCASRTISSVSPWGPGALWGLIHENAADISRLLNDIAQWYNSRWEHLHYLNHLCIAAPNFVLFSFGYPIQLIIWWGCSSGLKRLWIISRSVCFSYNPWILQKASQFKNKQRNNHNNKWSFGLMSHEFWIPCYSTHVLLA